MSKRTEKAEGPAGRLAFRFMERLAIPAFVLDDECRVVVWNRACERLTGVGAHEVVGTRDHWRAFYDEPRPCLADLVVQDRVDQSRALYTVRHATGEGGGLFVENWCVMPRLGKHLYLAIDASPVLDDEGLLIGVVETLRDMTEHKNAEAEIEHLASHDPLTGLANRSSFKRYLDMLNAAGEPYALLLVDIDRFKEINDTFGHAAGDALLCECASIFRSACSNAFAARLGGDEFAVVVAGETAPSRLEEIAGAILAYANEGLRFDGTAHATSFSIGMARVPEDASDAATIVRFADLALYEAKSAGGGTFRSFRPALALRSVEQRTAILDLRKAVEREEFLLHYQPVTRLDGEIVGFEALVRWRHPTRGIVPPADFIPLAEQSGLIGPIGEWVLMRACRDAAAWARPLQISVNLSPVQFRLGNIAHAVHQTLLVTGLAASRLELEITESAMIDNPSRTLAILRRLKALGVRIAMDDFGTGYSSLGYLQAFPFDKIKLDRSFIARLGQSGQADAITRAVIGLGHTLSLQILAEGVETYSQRDFLAAERCDLVQGYLFGRPAPVETFAEWTAAITSRVAS